MARKCRAIGARVFKRSLENPRADAEKKVFYYVFRRCRHRTIRKDTRSSMAGVHRLFVEKKKGLDISALALLADLRENLGIQGLSSVRLINRYDLEGITRDEYRTAREIVFAEPPLDSVYDESLPLAADETAFAVEYLPGQYDQRADSAAQCIQIITHGRRPAVAAARVIVLQGAVNASDLEAIKKYCINPVDSREAVLEKPSTLALQLDNPPDVPILNGFCGMTAKQLEQTRLHLGLAMRLDDLAFCQTYFRETEQRDPTLTEVRMLDTYWSDHCRHTTFLTKIKEVSIEPSPFTSPIEEAFASYRQSRAYVYDGREPKAMCLMDIATIGMKELRKSGMLDNLDASDEINACSIVIPAVIEGRKEPWLVMFKNETHNHPTEIEPFGGAATCLGGAIRDPLSGRSYVFHAMRVTGSGDPRRLVAETLPGKLPQRKITTLAAQGYSSYGNQIGLATGMVSEVYDEGFIAKRMEIGAVVGAAPAANVRRAVPEPGDIVLLVGGRTGRDGCGGATGSSKEHTEHSIVTCCAEVQKGNAPTERKIQRLFRDNAVARMIKRCNDFGAGGVSVAIGELAPGLDIDLDAVPKKYEGLDGTELAISESQERMAVVIHPADLNAFGEAVALENLEMAAVAQVTGSRRLRMKWRGKTIVDLSRDFIDTNGVEQECAITVTPPHAASYFAATLPLRHHAANNPAAAWNAMLSSLDVCCQRGLVERFDSTIGASSVLLPFGGKYQATPVECMVAKLPVLHGETTTGTAMSWGYLPRLALWSPFHGALYAVIDAVAKIVAGGGDHHAIRLTLQEYFEKLGNDRTKWGKPFSALLGSLYAQKKLGIAAIGGKDSMSGTFEEISVPPTLVAFALAPVDVTNVISPEFKKAGRDVLLLSVTRNQAEMPDFPVIDEIYSSLHRAIAGGAVVSAHTVRNGGIAEAIAKMSFGNRIGFSFAPSFDLSLLFNPDIGSIIAELHESADPADLFAGIPATLLGRTIADPEIRTGTVTLPIETLEHAWEQPLDKVFPQQPPLSPITSDMPLHAQRNLKRVRARVGKPRVLIPVFPGTNCEYDSARAFEKAGAEPHISVLRNITPADIDGSIATMMQLIRNSQILMIPGGFSAGDEPDGSGKFIAAFFRNPHLQEAVEDFLNRRHGLILGICNGFQALIKLGLVPWGEIRTIGPESPTLTFNSIGRHISRMAYTKVTSVKSPWFIKSDPGDLHAVPISHGEGRFIAPEPLIRSLFDSGQVATRYVNQDGLFSTDMSGNPNGSYFAIEGITSPDGRVLGKMGHSERKGENVAKNITGVKDQQLFESGVAYFK
ncbi:MAG: phosphoribosylformylglycinamidine synthase [Chitinispirillaceae bacterium]|nr:phosphoribosylformylglycinamidine synthase [Chitinispirillaceae bacterium]